MCTSIKSCSCAMYTGSQCTRSLLTDADSHTDLCVCVCVFVSPQTLSQRHLNFIKVLFSKFFISIMRGGGCVCGGVYTYVDHHFPKYSPLKSYVFQTYNPLSKLLIDVFVEEYL